ncbi:hypothetical protein [Rivibacter subsaxonicus]|uniref:Uncharacterized protein n=1 Tax=Rivibacter subsaxonicus TaxID=457575 RepID=A0A4Q7VNN4_9BURK|nr:hypothetical protein [Rivibacter subsaxonicus]RZT97996.1 hypothetical protein EV670_2397 [Rivibacter subsaxonicus]
MGITRRQFNGAAWRLGLTGAAGVVLGSCGGSDYELPPAAPLDAELKSFHFDLSAVPADDPHVLRVGGRRYPLKVHDEQSRQAARLARPGLAGVPDRHLTHYVDGVAVSLTRQQRMHVTTRSPTRGHGVALVAMYIPTASRIAARRARGLGAASCRGLCASAAGDDICTFEDQVEDGFVSGRSTAKAIITHYPDVLNLDGDIAAQVETHMDGDQAAAVDNFTQVLCDLGPAYEHDITGQFHDGWAVLVPRLLSDGSKILDSEGNPTFDYVYNDATSKALVDPVQAIVQAIRNDAALKDQQYQVIYHGDPIDTASFPEANPTPLVGDGGSVPAPQATASEVTFSTLGYHHNILFYGDQGSAANRQFTLKILNMNFVWYGLFFEHLDASGHAMNVTGSGTLAGVMGDLLIETDRLAFWDMISSPPAIFGIPTPFPYSITMKDLPAGVASVRLNLIGPGGYGNLPWGPSAIPGIAMTAVCQYMLPMFFLASGTGIDSTKTLIELILDKPSIWIKTLGELSAIISSATGSNKNDLGLEGSVESLLTAVVQNALVIPMEELSPELWAWITGTFVSEEVEDSVPFVGWILRAVAVAGTIGAMVATTAEIAGNPIVISNTVSFKHSINFSISYDPLDFEFPRDATHCVLSVTAGTTAITPGTVVQRPGNTWPDTLSVTIDDIPATGAPATVSVIFLSSTNYPLAHSAAVDINGKPVPDANGNPVAGDVSFTNSAPADGSTLVVNVPTVENAVPITASTKYTHHHKLTYASGHYGWTYTATPPAIEAAVCTNASGLCRLGNLAVWLPGGMIGASWQAASPTVTSCRGGSATGQLYALRNLSLKSDPNLAYKTPGCGFPAAAPLAYDMSAKVGAPNGLHFYLDVIDVSKSSPESHLRRIVLDTSTPVTAPSTQSWGRFRIPIDRIAVYSKGSSPRVVGISTLAHKLAVLDLPDAPYDGDEFANNAKVMSGQGEGNDELLYAPSALAIADGGAILILQGGATKSVKAFDIDGKPWKFFKGETSSVLDLVAEAGLVVTWLDISIEPTNLLYVLSHTGTGTQMSDFRLDIYDSGTGQRIVRNTGIAAASIVVDRFRGLYTLNYETVKGSPVVEPSVSVWSPST